MGGNALKCGSIRIDKELYQMACETLEAECEYSLYDYYDNVMVIPSYRNKTDFGDIDVICFKNLSRDCFTDLPTLLRETLGATELHKNGNVTSFDLRCFGLGECFEIQPGQPAIQVDLIEFTDWRAYMFAASYFSYNDLGNLIGRIAHNMGFKFGHDGLKYNFMQGTYKHEELILTQDFLDAIEFLGLDTERYLKGFDELEDIFEFVASSPYFHPDIFLLENRNGEARRRDRKRKTYNAFLKWCEENQERLTRYEFKKDPEPYLIEAFKAFPKFRVSYHRCVHEVFVKQHIKAQFNGDSVKQHTGFEGKKLGDFMTKVRLSFGADALFEQKLLYESEVVWARVYGMKDEFGAQYAE